MLNVPVLFLIFKRPEPTLRVFERIRKVRPKKLFIAADGPRIDVTGENELSFKTRCMVENRLDWKCEVSRLYSDENLGCESAVKLAIDWFFSHVEEGIILEDDTLPDPTFFPFCEALLKRHRNDSKVMHVSGNNYQAGRLRGDGAYYASQFAHSWGWATWARAWKSYDPAMPGFPEEWDRIADALEYSPARAAWWRHSLEQTQAGIINTWDWQWHYTIMRQKGVCLLPQINLVENIGVGFGATHTIRHTNPTRTRAAKLQKYIQPSSLKIHPEWDEFDFEHSVLNRRYSWRTLNEWWEFRKFVYKFS